MEKKLPVGDDLPMPVFLDEDGEFLAVMRPKVVIGDKNIRLECPPIGELLEWTIGPAEIEADTPTIPVRPGTPSTGHTWPFTHTVHIPPEYLG